MKYKFSFFNLEQKPNGLIRVVQCIQQKVREYTE